MSSGVLETHPILEGLRVVECASMIMVPSVGAILAEYGADVVKIEPLSGELNRRGHKIPGMPLHDHEYCFLPDNRNKRSIALDLKSEAGAEILRRLVKDADVFLTNYRVRALRSLSLTWEDLEAINPRLVYAHGTGFGDHGPEADKPGYDTVSYWSRSGMEANFFPIDGFIGSLGYGTGDHPAGMALFGAVLLQLLARERTGSGGRVSTSLLAAGAWSNAVLVQARLCEAEFLERLPREEARNFMAVYFRCSDDRIFKLAVVDHVQGWPRVCRALGREEWIEDPRFSTFEARSGRMPELVRLCDEIILREDLDHWRRAFGDADVPFSVVANYDEVVADDQMAANGVFVEVDDPRLGRVRSLSSPLRLDAHPKTPVHTAPQLGEHSRAVLGELGYDDEHIAQLIAAGSVGSLS